MASRGYTRLNSRSPFAVVPITALHTPLQCPSGLCTLHQTRHHAWTFLVELTIYFYSFITPRPIHFARQKCLWRAPIPTQRVHTQVMHDLTPLRVPPYPSPSCRAPNLVAHSDHAPPSLIYLYTSRAKVLVARATKPHSGITTSVDPTQHHRRYILAP